MHQNFKPTPCPSMHASCIQKVLDEGGRWQRSDGAPEVGVRARGFESWQSRTARLMSRSCVGGPILHDEPDGRQA